jgi:hypothetical protein
MTVKNITSGFRATSLAPFDPERCNGVGMPKGLARVRLRVNKGEGRRGWHSEYGSL